MNCAPSNIARSLASLLIAGIAVLAATTAARADNWPQWRGARLDGISAEKGVPIEWSKTKNVAWRYALPGAAGSTPVVWDDHIFLTSIDGADLALLCVGTDGKEKWRRVVARGNKDVRGDEGNSASPSPSTDGSHVWAFFAEGTLACFDFDGNEIWKVDVGKRYGRLNIAFGMTSTPVLDGDRIYLQLIHGEGKPETREATVACVDKLTGEDIWHVKRPSDASRECEHSYASPVLYRDGERDFLLTHGADYIVAHRLDDGSEIWRCGDLNPKGNYNPTLRFVASPVAVPGLIVVPSAKNGPVFGLRPDGKGDITDDSKAFIWRREAGTPDVPSPLVVDGLVYLCRENGNLICMDAKTGEEFYEERTVASRHRASPVYADGHIYLTARNEGMITVVKAGREFEIVAQNDMAEAISSSPVIANGRVYIRTFDALYAIGRVE